jgi:NAD-dependent SIR2 family protein deacetylase
MAPVNRNLETVFAPLRELMRSSRRLLVLTGAGCSTESGIPDYRDETGAWKRIPPVQLRDFLTSGEARRRYWARSVVGWPVVARARPNAAHRALARLERSGHVADLITQNVDGLHQRAGSRAVIDLHGRLDEVECLSCGAAHSRADLQNELVALNADFTGRSSAAAPDGDADLRDGEYSSFRVPGCARCGGLLKPRVVFFGEAVPRARVEHALACLHEADALLVVGSSLMVWSGYRFARASREHGIPLAIVNLGRTRADELATLRVQARCGEVLTALAEALCGAAPACIGAAASPAPTL